MIENPSPSRRHLMRMGAKAAVKIAAIASLPAVMSSKAEAAGRHSSFWEWCKDLVSPPGNSPGPSPICLLKGTLITTIDGPRPIENLGIGDRVLTHAGTFEPIKWVGRMSFRKAPGAAWKFGVAPVRIARNALWDGAPSRDLYVSQKHAVFDGSVLIAAAYLVNGASVSVCAPDGFDELDYYQLEFATHQVIYAEGAPLESYLPAGTRHLFDNYDEYRALYGSDAGASNPYAPEIRYPRGRDNAIALARLAAASVGVEALDPAQIYHRKLKARSAEVMTSQRSVVLAERSGQYR